MHQKNKKLNKKKSVKKMRPCKRQLPNNKKYMGQDAFAKREYSPSNYVQDKYSQYRINMDNYWPLQITEIPFYNDVFYSMPNSLGSPIYMQPSYETLQNASFADVIQSQVQPVMQPSVVPPVYSQPSYAQPDMFQPSTSQGDIFQSSLIEPNMMQQSYQQSNYYQQPFAYGNQNMGNQNMGNEGMFMERDSYFNTINSTNKEVDYKKFMEKPVIKKEKKKLEIKYIDKNKDYINIIIIVLLIFILFLNW